MNMLNEKSNAKLHASTFQFGYYGCRDSTRKGCKAYLSSSVRYITLYIIRCRPYDQNTNYNSKDVIVMMQYNYIQRTNFSK